ncbi:MAG: FAD-binding oxidoreductase [Pseudomonadota bacterium]
MDKTLLEGLKQAVGESSVMTDVSTLQTYGQDWTRFFTPAPSAVVFARDTAQLSALVGYANTHNLALVPSGGRTGLSGGAVAAQGEIVVSFDRMNRILDFDQRDATVVVEPGVVTQVLQAFATEQGLYYPVDFASSGSSQIGGNIATNAGGIKVLRYGLTRDQVTGLKVVTGRGDVLDLNQGLTKNATGYDLRHLFIGSEGTLGFIVEATIQLVRPPKDLTVVLLAIPQMTDVMAVLSVFRQQLDLTAFEFFSDRALAHVMAHHGVRPPFEAASPFYALLEFENDGAEQLERAMAAFEQCVGEGLASDGVLSQSEQQRRDLWKYREYISESITPHLPYKNDLSVRVSRVPAFLAAVDEVITRRYPDFETVWFGHIGDGNLHLNILKPTDWAVARFKRECEIVSEEVLALVRDFGGSVSAEHGVGLLKRDQLHFSRSATELALMAEIKRMFDPNGIMNPGKLLAAG